MQLKDLLDQKQDAIKQLWLDLVLKTYPPDSWEFFKSQKDRFQNPVGVTLSEQIDSLYNFLLKDSPDDGISSLLEDFIKIRVVQDFTPSKAIGYILYLKQAVREILADDLNSSDIRKELLQYEAGIDELLLNTFDVYVDLRQKLFEIRTDELRRRSFTALRMMNSKPE